MLSLRNDWRLITFIKARTSSARHADVLVVIDRSKRHVYSTGFLRVICSNTCWWNLPCIPTNPQPVSRLGTRSQPELSPRLENYLTQTDTQHVVLLEWRSCCTRNIRRGPPVAQLRLEEAELKSEKGHSHKQGQLPVSLSVTPLVSTTIPRHRRASAAAVFYSGVNLGVI